MNSPSEDIKDMITQSDGIGTFGVDVFISEEPDKPDKCATIYDSGGFDPETHNDISHPTVMLRVRGVVGEYKATYAKARVIVNLLDGRSNETLNGARYIQIFMLGEINAVGTDEYGRPVLTINFDIMRTE